MTTLLCPVSFVELRVGPSETSVPCPRCATRHDAAFLAPRDETLCACGHRLAAHGPRWGLAYACPTSGCGCRQPNPKETNMTATTTTHPLVQRDTEMLWDALGLDPETVRSPHQRAVIATVADRLDSDEVRELANVIANARRTIAA